MTIDVKERFRHKVGAKQVADVLQLIATAPNQRQRPLEGDVAGDFDFWFDGGAGRYQTGWNEYELTNGTQVRTQTAIELSIAITFPDGACVQIQQDVWRASDPICPTCRLAIPPESTVAIVNGVAYHGVCAPR